MSKKYTTIEAIQEIMKDKSKVFVSDFSTKIFASKHIYLKDTKTIECFKLTDCNLERTWELEPQEISFEDAFILYKKNYTIQSCLTKENYSGYLALGKSIFSASEDEIKGKWIVLDE